MESIKVMCKTNLDKYHKESWPREMCCRPVKGDYVYSLGGKKLKIVQISHAINEQGAFLDIELHN